MQFDFRGVTAAAVTAVTITILSPALAQDTNFLKGTFVQNQKCKGDGTDPKAKVVKFSEEEIDSSFGLCKFLRRETDGKTVSAQISCKGANGEMLGDVKFTQRDDNTVDFVDQDNTYKLVLYKCPETAAAKPPG
jgi:hypothetical protein